MRAFFLIFGLSFLPSMAQACDGQVVFSCQIKAKSLEVCAVGSVVQYSFGPRGQPELQIDTPIKDVEYAPWPGIGRYLYEAVVFRNGPYSYEVWSSVDRLVEGDDAQGKVTGGVVVAKSGSEIASLDCKPPSVVPNIDVLWDSKAAAGQCWNRDVQIWGACTN